MAMGFNRSTYREPFWQAVRSVRLAQTSLAHWRNLFGDRFAVAERWLKPSGTMASQIPKRGCEHVWFRVIEDTPHVYIAVDEERGCRVDVEPCEMAGYQFDFHRFAESIAAHFGFDVGDFQSASIDGRCLLFLQQLEEKKQYAGNPVLFLSNGLPNLTVLDFSGIY